jgi:hypothetical protein
MTITLLGSCAVEAPLSNAICGLRKAYKRGPSEAEMSWGLLIENVEKVEGMRGRRRWAVLARASMRALWRPLDGVDRWGLALWVDPG